MIKDRELYTRQDTSMYLSDCIVGVRTDEGIEAHTVRGVDSSILHLDNDQRSLEIDFYDERLILDWPTLGVVQFRGFVGYVMTESFDGAYKKGFNIRGTAPIKVPFATEVEYIGEPYLSHKVLSDMYDNKSLSLQEACALLSTHISVRIDRSFFVGHRYGYAMPLLGYRDKVVGEVHGDTVILFPSSAHLASKLESIATVEIHEG